MVGYGSSKLDAFVLGFLGQNSGEQFVVQRGISKPQSQRILLICQLLGDVSGIRPRFEIGVGRVVGAAVVVALSC